MAQKQRDPDSSEQRNDNIQHNASMGKSTDGKCANDKIAQRSAYRGTLFALLS